MRILIVNASGAAEWRGGVERGIALATSLLIDRGFELSLLQSVPAGGAGFVETTTLRSSPLGLFGRRVQNRVLDVASVRTRELDRIIARSGADIVHTHNLPGVTTAVWEAARRQGIPVLHSIHDYYLLCPRASLMDRAGRPCSGHPTCALRSRRLSRWAENVSLFTGVSDAVVAAHRRLLPNARFEVVRNPMVAYDRASMRQPTPEPLTVGYIGGLTREKGIEPLLEAARLLEHDRRFVFRIGGHGRLAPLVTENASRLGNLTYDGAVHPEQKRSFIDDCDVGIIPSVWAEPGGPTHVLAEWLTAGRPTLVSLRGGLAEVAATSNAIIPVEPTAPEIVTALVALAEPARWASVLDARATWDAEAEIARWIGRQVELYEELAAGR